MRQWLGVLSVFVGILLCAAVPAASLKDRLPDDAYGFVYVRDAPALIRNVCETGVVELLLGADGDVLGGIGLPETSRTPEAFVKRYVEPLDEVFTGGLLVAVVPGPDEVRPRVVVAAAVAETAWREYVEQALIPWLEEGGGEAKKLTLRGLDMTRLVVGGGEASGSVVLCVKNGVLFISTRPELVERLATHAPEKRLVASAGYADVRRLVAEADVEAFVNVAFLLEKTAASRGRVDDDLLEQLGFDRVRAAGWGMVRTDEGVAGTLRVCFEQPPRGVLSVFARPGRPMASLACVPPDAALCFSLDVGSLAAFVEEFADAEAAGDQVIPGDFTGFLDSAVFLIGETDVGFDELLPALGGEVAVVVGAPGPEDGTPVAAVVEVRDTAVVEQLLDEIIRPFRTAFGRELRVEHVPVEGVGVTTRRTGDSVLLVTAVAGDFLVAGPDRGMVEAIIKAKVSGRNAAGDQHLQALVSKVRGDAAFLVIGDFGSLGQVALKRVAETPGADVERAENLVELTGPAEGERQGFVLKAAGDDKGLTCRAFSQNQLTEPISTLARRVVYPSIARTRRDAAMGLSCSNVKRLTLAMHLYASDHDDRFPSKLSELVPYVKDAKVFVHPTRPVGSKPIDLGKPETIDAHADYEITEPGGDLGELPSSTVIIREKEAFAAGGRMCGFADGHAQFVREKSPATD